MLRSDNAAEFVGKVLKSLNDMLEIKHITGSAYHPQSQGQVESMHKTLNQLVEENKTLRNRQAAAAAISVCQLLIVIIYLLVIGVIYIVKCFKIQQAKQLEQNLQEMEERLQERKSKRRSSDRPPKEQ